MKKNVILIDAGLLEAFFKKSEWRPEIRCMNPIPEEAKIVGVEFHPRSGRIGLLFDRPIEEEPVFQERRSNG